MGSFVFAPSFALVAQDNTSHGGDQIIQMWGNQRGISRSTMSLFFA